MGAGRNGIGVRGDPIALPAARAGEGLSCGKSVGYDSAPSRWRCADDGIVRHLFLSDAEIRADAAGAHAGRDGLCGIRELAVLQRCDADISADLSAALSLLRDAGATR